MTEAVYIHQEVPGYRGNPFIEALPPILSKAQVISQIAYYPPYDSKLRTAKDEIRHHLVRDAQRFFVPLPRHFIVEQAISSMIRVGYQSHNPVSLDYWRTLKDRVSTLRTDLRKLVNVHKIRDRKGLGRSSALCAALFGISGTGKFTMIQECLALYPQVIRHGEYFGYPLNISQVVWLYLEIPSGGSAKGLCLAFFGALDKLLGTHYVRLHGSGNVDEMLVHMAEIAGVHAVGVIVVDEIQKLSRQKSGGQPGLLDFFLQLTNTMKVPIFLIGTEDSVTLLEGRLRDIRRTSGIPEWLPLTSEEWKPFLKALWRYQYTRTRTEITDEVSETLYAESHGIPDIAVKVYFNAQSILIGSQVDSRSERITIAAIRSAMKLYHKRIEDHLRRAALKGDFVPRAENAPVVTLAEQPKAGSPEGNAHPEDSMPTLPPRVESVLGGIASQHVTDDAALYASLKDAGLTKCGLEFAGTETPC